MGDCIEYFVYKEKFRHDVRNGITKHFAFPSNLFGRITLQCVKKLWN